MLHRTPRLSTADQHVLAEVASMRRALHHAVQQVPTKWTLGLRRHLTASAIAASNAIEGYRVDARDVADLMDDAQEKVDVSEANRAETVAYQQAMTYIQSLHAAPDFEYSKGLLNALHWMLQGHHPHKPAGQWRRGPVFITAAGDPHATEYEGPHEDDVSTLMDELIDWLNSGDMDSDPLVRAAMAHFNLVKIHPWADGNGRMSRSLQTLLIAREGVLAPEFSSIEAWLGMPGHTWDYYKVLREVGGPVYSPVRDTALWVRFNLRAYHEQTQSVRHRVDRSNKCWIQLDERRGALGVTEHQITALHEVAVTGRVRRSRYERAEGISEQQAQRDMRHLTRENLLTPIGNTKGRYYVPGSRYPQNVLDTAAARHTVRNPYEDIG
ncbi:Fic family protein [Streptomyces nitrosporeus]|uniref:Fic family protein n=1 Tax=Streptomyces nitrosporeus TaxID=28894 RepID=A0A5J6FN52_9ACTN|nr:Fic family protein [Streptomyces nitrosporeus]QEU76734.1 Fic family protein [Streptomyces nitrosporeus]